MSNSVSVRFDAAEEGNDTGFDVRGQDVHLNSKVHDGSEDLGELLPASPSLDQRAEVVLETTVDDARRVRQLHGVNHISERKVGPHGRVCITVVASCHYVVASLTVRGAMRRVVFFAYQRSMDFWMCLV